MNQFFSYYKKVKLSIWNSNSLVSDDEIFHLEDDWPAKDSLHVRQLLSQSWHVAETHETNKKEKRNVQSTVTPLKVDLVVFQIESNTVTSRA